MALSTCSNWSNNFIVGLLTPPLVERTAYGTYVVFAIFCLLSLVWTLLFVPETSGKTLEEMDHLFSDAGSAAEYARIERIRRTIINDSDD